MTKYAEHAVVKFVVEGKITLGGKPVDGVVTVETMLTFINTPLCKKMVNWFLEERSVYPWNRKTYAVQIDGDQLRTTVLIVFNNQDDATKFVDAFRQDGVVCFSPV